MDHNADDGIMRGGRQTCRGRLCLQSGINFHTPAKLKGSRVRPLLGAPPGKLVLLDGLPALLIS